MPDRINDLERQQAKRDGAKVVKNSGRGMNKGDATIGNYMVDYKFTDSKSYTLKVEDFKKLEKQAWREGKQPITVVIFEEYKGKATAIIDWDLLKELIDDEE